MTTGGPCVMDADMQPRLGEDTDSRPRGRRALAGRGHRQPDPPAGGHYSAFVSPSEPGGGIAPAARPVRGFPLGRIIGVPIVVAPSWVLSVAIIVALGIPVITDVVPGTSTSVAVLVSILLGILLGLSVLAHELGHCLLARLLGIDVLGVRLYLLGGVSELGRAPRTPRDEALIAAAGPAVSAVIAGICWAFLGATRIGTVSWLFVFLLALSNLVIALFNLLPALPMDGGRVLRAGVWRAFGNRRAGTRAAVVGGYLIAAALVVWAITLVVGTRSGGVLPAGIALAMALFVAVGAAAERPRRPADQWPAGLTLASLATPILQLPAHTPVRAALDAVASGEVLLTDTDGMSRGLLDLAAATTLADRDPLAPASLAGRPLSPESIVLPDDDPAEVLRRARSGVATIFLLTDGGGRPVAALRSEQLVAALGTTRGHWWELSM
jgi:Zn-dependent protease